ncbi:MAG TPA: hypothetical protein VMX13_16020, partial [Sedimentisphaerales bacterium]|nr:hypothetical protein [Sedimentisphaerales bacterium]
MEGLIFFLAELLRILLTAAVVVLVMLFLAPELVVVVLEVILRLFFVVGGRSERAKKGLRWIRIGGLAFLVIFVVCIMAAAVLNPHISQGNQNQRRRVILAESWFSRLVLTHSAHNSPLPPYSNRDFR